MLLSNFYQIHNGSLEIFAKHSNAVRVSRVNLVESVRKGLGLEIVLGLVL